MEYCNAIYNDEYIKDLLEQCKRYVYIHFRNNGVYSNDDIAQEMFALIWQSYCNNNGLSEVIKKQKLVPSWQIHLIFLNALRNLGLLHDKTELSPHSSDEQAKVIKDENGEIIDFYYPSPDPLEEQEKETKKSKVPVGKERERWLKKIKRLRERGYSNEEIVRMLKPVKQGVLF